MMQASEANEGISEFSMTGSCHEERHENHLNVTGVQISRLHLNRNLTQFRPSEIEPQDWKGSLTTHPSGK